MTTLLQKHQELFPRYKAMVEIKRAHVNKLIKQTQNALKTNNISELNHILENLGSLYAYGDNEQKSMLKTLDVKINEVETVSIERNIFVNKTTMANLSKNKISNILFIIITILTFSFPLFAIKIFNIIELVSAIILFVLVLFFTFYFWANFSEKSVYEEEYGRLEKEVSIMEKALDISHERDIPKKPFDVMSRPSIHSYASV